jgi:hypothetical protein
VVALGLKDSIKGIFSRKSEPETKQEESKLEEKQAVKKAKYPYETCALCGQPACDMKWAGQYWHKKCLRSVRKAASSMI